MRSKMMKKTLALLMMLSLLLGIFSGCGGQQTKDAEGLQVGFGREKIMPEHVMNLAGGDSSVRESTGYSDYLYVTCIAITEGENTVLLYTTDTLTMSANFSDGAEEAITEATGVPAENILMNATHTHAAPVLRDNSYSYVDIYQTQYAQAAKDAALSAMADRSAAVVYAGGTQTENMSFVRHYKINDGTYAGSNFGSFSAGIADYACEADEQVQVVKFARAAEDKKDVVLMNFTAHCTMNQSGTVISADYPGPTRDYVEANSDSLCAFFISAAGNQAPTSRIATDNKYTDYRTYGQKLGSYVTQLLPQLGAVSGNGIKLRTQTLTFASCKDGLERLQEAKETQQAGKSYGYKGAQTLQLIAQYGFSSIYEANAIVTRASAEDTRSMTVNTLAVGDLAFVLAPYEMSGVHGIQIKEKSPYENTFIITCFEDHVGYLPTKEACTDFKSYEYCVTKFEVGTGEKMVDAFVKMLIQMKEA